MIKFFNIRSGETRDAETEPQISAMWASSDRSPNVAQGQDFGWRLAPEVVVEMKMIKQDVIQLTQIATRIGKPTDDINEPDILDYISAKYTAENAPVADTEDYADAYDMEVRKRMKEAEQAPVNPAPTTTQTTTESLADMEKRAELAERIAKANVQANQAPTLEPPKKPETTTTTTKIPTTTTTTTKVK